MTEARAPITRAQWSQLLVLVGSVSIMVVNGTVLAVLLPVIITDLGLTNTQAAWANSAFALVFAALLLPAGWLGDRWGQRRVLVAGLILFLIGAVLVGTASSGATFIAARAIQGAAGAMISPSALAIVNSTFRGSQRVAAFGVWGAVMGGMAGLGPLMGGWIGDVWGWRAAFLLNVPLVILALLGIRRVLDDVQSGVARRFDLVGLLLSAGALVLLVFGLIQGYAYGWIRPATDVEILGLTWPATAPVSIIPFILALGLTLAVLFFGYESRRMDAGHDVLADVRLFGYRSFRLGNITLIVMAVGQIGLFFTLPLFCQIVLGYSTTQTGWVFVSLALGAMVSAALGTRLGPRLGLRTLIVLGLAISAVTLGALAWLLSVDMSPWLLGSALFVYGFGSGLANAQLTSVTLWEVPTPKSGQASALQSTARQIGSSLGTAVLGTVLAIVVTSQVSSALQAIDVPDPAVNPIAEAVATSSGTSILVIQDAQVAGAFEGNTVEPFVPAVIEASTAGYTEAVRITLSVGALFLLAAAALATALPKEG